MILMRILPSVLKELSKHVPTVLFQTVDWGELALEIPKISRRIIQKEGYQELFEVQKRLLAPLEIILTNEALTSHLIKDKKWAGNKILTLYFTQIYSSDGLFLDLRSNHFYQEDKIFQWSPSGPWTIFNEKFRQGLIKVYDGFYLQNDQLYYQGMEEIGLFRPEFGLKERKELGDLFRIQFGNALHTEMKFELEHLKKSIISMSDFMLNKKVKISKDFLYLGIYLVTMYSILEELGEKYPVKEIYLEVREHFLKFNHKNKI
jgi:hypothetical protein